MKKWFPVLLPLMTAALLAADAAWQMQPTGTSERLRGVSAVSDTVAWASGNKGTVVRTDDGGQHWTVLPVPGAEALDFRDIEAIDARTAYVLAIGAGDKSRIYKTRDAGKQWTLQFTSTDPKAFYDAIAFWDERNGIAVGDLVDGRFTILRTADGGSTWSPIPDANRPQALDGEGMFAASGTCLTTLAPGDAWFGTGGAARSRIFRSSDRGVTWSSADTPIASGTSSAGVFSIAFSDRLHGLAVGGDYRKERESGDNIATTADGGKTWTLPGATRLRGFRSGVAFVQGDGRVAVAVGPAGTDRTVDGGRSWTPIDDTGFHAVSVGRVGTTAWAAGEQGRVGKTTVAAK